MKELEVTIRVRNNRLKERRAQLGMSQAELANAVGVTCSTYNGLESMRLSPLLGDGSWREAARKLANFHCVAPEHLFPASVLAVDTPVATRRVDAADLGQLLSESQAMMLEGPGGAQERAELRERVQSALASLGDREANVLRLRFGLGGNDRHTLDEVAAHLGKSRERTRQIEARALHILRHPKSALSDLSEFAPQRSEEKNRRDRQPTAETWLVYLCLGDGFGRLLGKFSSRQGAHYFATDYVRDHPGVTLLAQSWKDPGENK